MSEKQPYNNVPFKYWPFIYWYKAIGTINSFKQPKCAFPYEKDQLVTVLLQPCLVCHVPVAKMFNRQQGIHMVCTDSLLIVIA